MYTVISLDHYVWEYDDTCITIVHLVPKRQWARNKLQAKEKWVRNRSERHVHHHRLFSPFCTKVKTQVKRTFEADKTKD